MKMLFSFLMTILLLTPQNLFSSLVCWSELYKLQLYYSNDMEMTWNSTVKTGRK